MAPDLFQREIGIRPGEKLHELMISEDDARTTVEFSDRYAILTPFLNLIMADYENFGVKAVSKEFKYASDSNDDWLSQESFKSLVEM